MKFHLITAVLSSALFAACNLQMQTTIKTEKNCRERTRLIASDSGDLYGIVDAPLGRKLILQCHYCSNENDDHQPKIWRKIRRLSDKVSEEVHLDMETNLTLNRVHVNPEHTLTIQNVTSEDLGLYYCAGVDGQESEKKYNYLVDVVDNSTTFETGNLTDWRKYHEMYIEPVNKMLYESRGDEYVHLRDDLGVQIETVTEWEEWEACEVCGRPKGEGRKKKRGYCRLKIYAKKHNATHTVNKTNDEDFLTRAFEVSCRSLVFTRLFPAISNQTRIIPHFIQEEHCDGICNPDAEGANQGWKTGKGLGFKYRKSFVLAENSHLTLICPEATLDNVIVWKKNGKVLKAGESVVAEKPEGEPRITVDTFNTLYLYNVKSSEEGNYTCLVDDVRMQQVIIFVVSKSKLLTQAFVRHLMYLGFVLSLTVTCYCAGLIVTCTRWRTFKTYEEIMESQPHDKDDIEDLL